MDINTTVSCATTIDWLNDLGVSIRKIVYKFAILRLLRNEAKEIYVELSADKAKPIKLRLSGIVVHKKFMAEGKASIKFTAEKCILFISNAPPAPLMIFLKTLFIKMTGEKAAAKTTKRSHLLTTGTDVFEDISPITNAEVVRAQKIAGGLKKGSETTPSPLTSKKRKLECGTKVPAAKKLYTSSENDADAGYTHEKLNSEQMEVYQACLTGKNVFFTGSGKVIDVFTDAEKKMQRIYSLLVS